MALQQIPDYYGPMSVPDPAAAYEAGILWSQKQKEAEKARARQAAMETDYAALAEGPLTSVKLRDFTFKYPEVADKFKGVMDSLGADERKNAVNQFMPAATALFSGNTPVAEAELRKLADAYGNAGDAEKQGFFAQAADAVKTSPDAANVVFSMVAHSIDPDWAGKVETSQKTIGEIAKAKAAAIKAAEHGGIEVSQVKYWPNGVTMVIGKNNEQMVRDASGRVLTGDAADTAVKSGMAADIRLAGGRAGAAAAAEADVRIRTGPGIAAAEQASRDAVALSTDAFKKIPLLETQISNYDEAIRLVEKEGANTGVIASKFPSITASAVALDNLQKSMGLDIIATSLPGAASEGDVRMALQTALPTGLDGPELAQWIRNKKEATKRVLTGIKRVAKYMGKGNTVAQYLEAYADEAAPPAAPAGTVPANDLAAAAAAELARRRGGG